MTIDIGPALYGEAYPDGLWFNEGNQPAGLPQTMLYWRASHDGRRVGKGQEFQTPYWNGEKWLDLGPCIGENACAFGPNGTVYVSRPTGVDVYNSAGQRLNTIPGYVGSQGIRFIKDDGAIVSGDSTYKHPNAALWEYTDIGDGILIGQGLKGVVALVGTSLRQLTSANSLLSDGKTPLGSDDARFVRVNRIGDAVAIAHADLVRARSTRILTTVQEIRNAPLVVEEPAKTPDNPPPPPPPPKDPPVSIPGSSEQNPKIVGPYQDPDLDAAVRASWAGTHNGAPESDGDRNYWKELASNPAQFSDGIWRLGWNRYWEDRMAPENTGSANPKDGDLPAVYQPGTVPPSDPNGPQQPSHPVDVGGLMAELQKLEAQVADLAAKLPVSNAPDPDLVNKVTQIQTQLQKGFTGTIHIFGQATTLDIKPKP